LEPERFNTEITEERDTESAENRKPGKDPFDCAQGRLFDCGLPKAQTSAQDDTG